MHVHCIKTCLHDPLIKTDTRRKSLSGEKAGCSDRRLWTFPTTCIRSTPPMLSYRLRLRTTCGDVELLVPTVSNAWQHKTYTDARMLVDYIDVGMGQTQNWVGGHSKDYSFLTAQFGVWALIHNHLCLETWPLHNFQVRGKPVAL